MVVEGWALRKKCGRSSPCAKLCHAHHVEMHNVFKISAASTESVILSASLRTTREILKTLLNNPGHGSGRWLEVTEFSTRGGWAAGASQE
ncbi:hypothetical protein D6D24_05075 [Aureobasidium pullulans]|uniref:Uncharacterized protein n=2 Tax=Aureobasidium pullulans TaxID=5580 RepID=A0A4S8VSC7_AURPU|nr:hypothetical protein D6D24_05075 [Aureobasidium pullulans]THX27465.1 hypothetical protein D6D12_05488 [Aureobasidium pullulans]